jgi:acetoin utilization deacetylase AcuC-like enzyme
VEKYRALRRRLEKESLFYFEPAQPSAQETICLAHDGDYVQQFLSGTLAPAAMRRIGLPWSEALVQRALASVGGTISAASDALRVGWGGTLGGGTHHAGRSGGAGFCVFNDIAVAIHALRKEGRIRRAAVLDLDVHQGDGTAEIFRGDPEVMTLSIHCQSNFPFCKQQSTVDIALPDKVEDDQYLSRLDDALPRVFAFQPEIVFYQSGVDGLSTDVLGRLALTAAGLKERDRRVIETAHLHGVPLVITSGGGYSRPIELSVEAHANTYLTAAQVFGPQP